MLTPERGVGPLQLEDTSRNAVTEAKVAACINRSDRNQSSQRPILKCTERHSEVLGIRSADPRFAGGNTGAHGPLYLDGDLLQRDIKHAHGRTEQDTGDNILHP